MTLSEISALLKAEVIVGEDRLDFEVNTAVAADIMSEVLYFAIPGGILLTGLTNPLVISTVETTNLKAIIFVRGKRPLSQIVDLAIQKDMPLLTTRYIMFEVCGRLYEAGIKGPVIMAE
jgi:predicted transcriptional regulator